MLKVVPGLALFLALAAPAYAGQGDALARGEVVAVTEVTVADRDARNTGAASLGQAVGMLAGYRSGNAYGYGQVGYLLGRVASEVSARRAQRAWLVAVRGEDGRVTVIQTHRDPQAGPGAAVFYGDGLIVPVAQLAGGVQ